MNWLPCYTWGQWCKVFQPISLYIIFFRSFPVRYLSVFHFHHFLADSNFLQTVYILISFSTVFHPLSVLVMFFCYTPGLILFSEFGIILPLYFSLFSSLYTYFWLNGNSCFCLNCVIVCSYLLTSVFFSINLCFNSLITRFIIFFSLYI